jgi:hypothetical protein
MRNFSLGIIVIAAMFLDSAPAEARDTRLLLSIKDVLETPKAKEVLGTGVKFYFGEQKYGTPQSTMGTYTTNKKTNAFNKSDKEACEWVFLSALVQLRDRAQSEGGNAVVKITSYYKKSVFSSETQFECHAGNVVAGVALRGEVVKL